MECSAKSGMSVDEVFSTLGRMMKERIIDLVEKEPPLPPIHPPTR